MVEAREGDRSRGLMSANAPPPFPFPLSPPSSALTRAAPAWPDLLELAEMFLIKSGRNEFVERDRSGVVAKRGGAIND